MKILRVLIVILLLAAGHAQAAYTVYVYQSGADVIASGIGSINLSGLVLGPVGAATSRVQPNAGLLAIGATLTVQAYDGIVGPAAIGPGGSNNVSSSTASSSRAAMYLARRWYPVPPGWAPPSPVLV